MKKLLIAGCSLIVIALAVAVAPATVHAQQTAAIVMTRNTDYCSQIWYANTTYQQAWIDRWVGEGLFIGDATFGPGGWFLVMSPGLQMTTQGTDVDSVFENITKRFPQWWRNGFSITDIVHTPKGWMAIASIRVGYQEQLYLTGKIFPESEIRARLKEGYSVTTVEYGEGMWVAMMTKGTGYTDQQYLSSGAFPKLDIDRYMADGYAITGLEYGDSTWAVVLSRGTGFGEQVYEVGTEISEDFINDKWSRGYNITSVAYASSQPLNGSANNFLVETNLTQIGSLQNGLWFIDYINAAAPTVGAFVAVQRMAGYYLQQKQWKQAAETYRKYQSLFPDRNEQFDAIIDMIERDEEPLVAKSLGNGINTGAGEFMPLPSIDDSLMFFTGKNRAGGAGGEDIFVSSRVGNTWGRATGLPGKVNSSNNEFATAISADGNRILFFSNRTDGLGRGDIYSSERTANGWGEVKPFPAPVNSAFWDCDGFMTSDGKAILFTSDRPGAIGGYHRKDLPYYGEPWGNTDIWVSLKTADGWSQPVNLGPNVNTPFGERTPFLHPDGKTLFFCSVGHDGFGGLDVFVVRRLKENSWTEWSKPINLGRQVNTVGEDWGYKVNTIGNVAYYSAGDIQNPYGGGSDLFSISVPDYALPAPVATIRGTVTDPDGKPLVADIKWEDLIGGKNVGELRTDPTYGTYVITLPLGKKYGYYADKEGYYPVSKNIDLTKQTTSINLVEDIVLVPVKQAVDMGLAVRLNNVFFDTDDATLKPESKAELDRLANLLKQYPDARVEIAGHTDNTASDVYNTQLSTRRAKAVITYLVSVGCNPKKLSPKGYGESRPVATNDTEEGRALNRRVEFQFLKK